jgi:hypothetical protein
VIEFLALFTAKNTMAIMLLLLITIVVWVMIAMTRNQNDTFDLRDLITRNGKLDEKKFTRFGAWVVSTWGFVYLLINESEKLSEWYFIGYMGAWVVNAIFDKYVNKPTSEEK